MDGSSRHSYAEELRLVDQKLAQILSELQRLRAEKQQLEERKKTLQELIKKPKEENKDWSKADFPWSTQVSELSQSIFGIKSFRPNQLEIINCTLSKRDCFVIMRTGIPALVTGGVSVVISPLLSLINDQVLHLNNARPGTASMLIGSMSVTESTEVFNAMKDARQGLKLVYVTPEKVIKSKRFMGVLEKLHEQNRLDRFIIDEAHCASQMGHDYRPDYAKLGVLRRLFQDVPILALTATATPEIIRDVTSILEMTTHEIFKSSSYRPNLLYEVRRKKSKFEDQIEDIAGFIKEEYPRSSGIIYCFSQKECENVTMALQELGIKSGCYHAGVDPADKDQVQRQWMAGRLKVVVATIAFGLGINKPDVRYVIHLSMSKSVESYYQESGRGGRDGEIAKCILYYKASDPIRIATLVMYERTGIANLRRMTDYAQNLTICRRVLIARCLGDQEISIGEGCGDGCDVCRWEGGGYEVLKGEDVAMGLVRVLKQSVKREKRVTPKQLIDEYLKEMRKQKSTAVWEVEDIERLINELLKEGVLKEDFHATAYSTILYLLPAYNCPLLERGELWIRYERPIEAEQGVGDVKGKRASCGSSKEHTAEKKAKTERSKPKPKDDVEVLEIDSSDNDCFL